jgi:lactoylglutathione lyase
VRYLHTMVRVADLDAALDFYCRKLGLVEVRRKDSEKGRFTLVFLAAPQDEARAEAEAAPLVELTYNWDPETYTGGRNFGHLAYEVDDIYETCVRLQAQGVTINRPPRDGNMPSSARLTGSPSSCCRRARPCRRASPGPPWPILGAGRRPQRRRGRPCRLAPALAGRDQ